MGGCVCVCIKLSDLCVSRQTGRRFNNCTLRSVMDLSGMSGLSENHKKLIAAHCVSGFNLPPLLISQHLTALSPPHLWAETVDVCAWEFVVVGGSACIDTNSCHRCVGMRGSARRWGHRRLHARVRVRMDQILKGAALLASPGANVIANDKASRRVC